MTVSDKPPVPTKDPYSNFCPKCGDRAFIAFSPNAQTLRYECARFPYCDYEHNVPKRLPEMTEVMESADKIMFISSEDGALAAMTVDDDGI